MTREQVVAVLLGVVATRLYLWLRGRFRDRVDAPVIITATRPLTIDELRPLRVGLVDDTGRSWTVLRLTRTTPTDSAAESLVVELIPIPKEPS